MGKEEGGGEILDCDYLIVENVDSADAWENEVFGGLNWGSGAAEDGNFGEGEFLLTFGSPDSDLTVVFVDFHW